MVLRPCRLTAVTVLAAALFSGAAYAATPKFKHSKLNAYPATAVGTNGTAVKLDGDVSDWDPKAFVRMYADPDVAESFALNLALAYDEQGILVAGKFRDDSPLVNKVDPAVDPFKAWEGDCMQLRFITNPAWAGKIPDGQHNADAVVHATLWQYTEKSLPALDVRYGMDFHAAVTKTGPASGLQYRKIEGGYSVEGRIPYDLLKAKAPQPGQSWGMTMQPLWGSPGGDKLLHYFFDVVSAAGFQFQTPKGWGQAYFVKPDEVAAKYAEQAAEEQRIFGPASPAGGKGGIAVAYENPADGFVSLGVFRENGQLVRTLLAKAKRPAGKQVEQWDGRDDDGSPAAAGKYVVKGLAHDGIKPVYVASVMNSGTPGWGNAGDHLGWGADHTAAIAVAADNEGNVYPVWSFNEGGSFLIQVTPEGKKTWGAQISWGDFSGGARAVVVDGDLIYVAKDGSDHGAKNKRSTGGLFVYERKTGRRVNFPNGTGTAQVTEWSHALKDNVPGAITNLTAITVTPDKLFAALLLEGKLVALDKKTFKEVARYDLPAPRALIYKADENRIYAVSGDKVVKVDPATGRSEPFITAGVAEARGLALDKAGNVYVSVRGDRHQVLAFDSSGKPTHEIGKRGGRPAMGAFDKTGMYKPAGIAIDPRTNNLWVMEEDETPKRQSVWNAATGALVRDYYGSTAYAPMMAPDLEDPQYVYMHNTRFRVDYDTGAWEPVATVFRKGHGGGTTIESSEQGFGFMGNTFQVASFGGRKFAFNGHGGVFAFGETFKPLTYIGSSFHGGPKLPQGAAVVWRDENGDGFVQNDAESTVVRDTSLRNNIHQFGGTFHPGGAFIKGRKIFKPSGVDDRGMPLYPDPKEAPGVIQGGSGAMREFGNWLDVWPSYKSDWSEFYAIASRPAPNGSSDGSGGDSIVRFDRQGNIKWRYNRVAVNFGLKAPLAKAGDLFGALRIAGLANLPQSAGGDEIVSIGSYRGYFGFMTEDGLFVDQIGYDNGRGPAANFDVFFIENFSGYFFQHKDTKRYYLFAGDVDGRILELKGWDSVKRIRGDVTVTPAAFDQTVASAPTGTGRATGATVLRVAKRTPTLDAALGDWDAAKLASIELDEQASAKAGLAYDAKNLYAAFDVPDASAWKNASGDWHFLFKGGDAVDVQIGTGSTTGEGGKRPFMQGDVRVLVGPGQGGGKPLAVAMWKRAPAAVAAKPQLYKSPTGEEQFSHVAQIDADVRVKPSGDGYTVEMAIPWAELQMTPPQADQQLRGDLGVLLSDGGGTKTTLRRYLFNRDTGIVNDIPNEVRVNPAAWGVLAAE